MVQVVARPPYRQGLHSEHLPLAFPSDSGDTVISELFHPVPDKPLLPSCNRSAHNNNQPRFLCHYSWGSGSADSYPVSEF